MILVRFASQPKTLTGHAVHLEKVEAVMSALLPATETTQHVDVWDVEGRGQQVTRQTHKLMQAHLQVKRPGIKID